MSDKHIEEMIERRWPFLIPTNHINAEQAKFAEDLKAFVIEMISNMEQTNRRLYVLESKRD
jgi:hypothetical protein